MRNWAGDQKTLTFWAKSETALDPAEREARRRRIEELRDQAEAERNRKAEEAVTKSAKLWDLARDVDRCLAETSF